MPNFKRTTNQPPVWLLKGIQLAPERSENVQRIFSWKDFSVKCNSLGYFVIYWSLHVASGILGDTTHISTAPDKTLKNHSVIIWQYVLEVENRVWLILYWIVQDCGCINFLYYFLPVVKYMPKRNSYNENLHRLCCKEKTYAK